MTAQQLLVAALDYHRIIARTGVPIAEATRRYANGLIEYLCVAAEMKEDGLPESGEPYQADLEETHHQIALDCERDAAKEYDHE